MDRAEGVNSTLNLALGTLSEQLQKLALKSRAATFTGEEARVLTHYIKALVELSKEEREREKSDKDLEKLKDMTDAELLELANTHLKSVEAKVPETSSE
jgi:protein subunit release factor A